MKKCLLLFLVSFYTFGSDTIQIKKEFLWLNKMIMAKPKMVEVKADSVLKICEDLNWKNGIAEATYYKAASQLYNFNNTESVKKLLDVAEKMNSNADLKIQILLAKSYSSIIEDQYQEAFSLTTQALSLTNKIKANHHLYRIFINFGNVFAKLDNHEKALEYYEKAYHLTNKDTSEDQKITLFNNINTTLSKNMDSKKAIFYSKKMVEIFDSNTLIRKKYGQISYIGIAYIYILLRDIEKAEYYLKFVEQLQQGKETNYLRPYYLTNLGYVKICKKEFEAAESNLKESVRLSFEFKDNYIRYRTYQVLANLYFAKGNFESGLTFQEKSFALRDSITSLNHQKFIANAETKYKTAEKEAKLKEAQLEISQKRNWIIGLSLGFLGIMVTGGLLWRISSIKTKAEESEKLKNLEIENQKKLLSAKEIERQRIAKELHDSVGSQLTVVSTSLDNAFYLFEKQKLVPEKIENISGEVRLAAQSLRDTIWATYNSEISVLELKSRIQEFINKFGDQNTFKIEMDIAGDEIILTPIEGLNLFRIVQESLNNIQKHAGASLVQIKGEFKNDRYSLLISDDGKGFDLEQGKLKQSYGLNNMKIRAEEIGGEFNINTENGTKIIISK